MNTADFLSAEYAKQLLRDTDVIETELGQFNARWVSFWDRNKRGRRDFKLTRCERVANLVLVELKKQGNCYAETCKDVPARATLPYCSKRQ